MVDRSVDSDTTHTQPELKTVAAGAAASNALTADAPMVSSAVRTACDTISGLAIELSAVINALPDWATVFTARAAGAASARPPPASDRPIISATEPVIVGGRIFSTACLPLIRTRIPAATLIRPDMMIPNWANAMASAGITDVVLSSHAVSCVSASGLSLSVICWLVIRPMTGGQVREARAVVHRDSALGDQHEAQRCKTACKDGGGYLEARDQRHGDRRREHDDHLLQGRRAAVCLAAAVRPAGSPELVSDSS